VVRAVIALILMSGFYAFAIGVAVGLIYIAFNVDSGRITLISLGVAGVILWSLIPRRDRFVEPGPRLQPSSQPRLFERLNKLSRAVGQAMPREVYLLSDMNAWVMERGGILGFGRKRVMGIGLPLLQVLTISEFEAVLAHEFGHYDGGDTKLGPLIYRTRYAISRTVENLSKTGESDLGMLSFVAALVQKPFYGYGVLFLRITLAISRAQEFAADRLAARTVGASALANGLRAVHKGAAISNYYMNNEVLPVVQSGFQPPVSEGFGSFLKTESIVQSMDAALESELKNPKQDPYDTHPPLAQRIAAIETRMDTGHLDSTPAISLLQDVPSLETQLIRFWLPPKAAALKPVQWIETGGVVWIPVWEKTARENKAILEGITLGDLHLHRNGIVQKIKGVPPGTPENVVRDYAANVVGAAIACVLHRQGWTAESLPGVMWMTKGSSRINPFDVVSQIFSKSMDESTWRDQMNRFGLDATTRLI
jgi:heat shock protein HtpX